MLSGCLFCLSCWRAFGEKLANTHTQQACNKIIDSPTINFSPATHITHTLRCRVKAVACGATWCAIAQPHLCFAANTQRARTPTAANERASKQTNKRTDKQTDKQTNKQTSLDLIKLRTTSNTQTCRLRSRSFVSVSQFVCVFVSISLCFSLFLCSLCALVARFEHAPTTMTYSVCAHINHASIIRLLQADRWPTVSACCLCSLCVCQRAV